MGDLSPDWARSSGLHFVHQDPAIFPILNVAENIAIGRGFPTAGPWAIRQRYLRRRTQEILDRFEIDVRPTDMIENLGPAQRAMVAIARALQDQDEHSGGLLILDEPTASLPGPEVDMLLDALRTLRRAAARASSSSATAPPRCSASPTASPSCATGAASDGRRRRPDRGAHRRADRRPQARAARPATRRPAGRDSDPACAQPARPTRSTARRSTCARARCSASPGSSAAGAPSCSRRCSARSPLDSGTVLVDGEPVRFAGVGEAMDAGFAYVPEDRATEASFAA